MHGEDQPGDAGNNQKSQPASAERTSPRIHRATLFDSPDAVKDVGTQAAMEEIHSEDRHGLRGQERPPGSPGPPGCRRNAIEKRWTTMS
jgi:hypothetical protein